MQILCNMFFSRIFELAMNGNANLIIQQLFYKEEAIRNVDLTGIFVDILWIQKTVKQYFDSEIEFIRKNIRFISNH